MTKAMKSQASKGSRQTVEKRPRHHSFPIAHSFLRQRSDGGFPSTDEVLVWAESKTFTNFDCGHYLEMDKCAAMVKSTITIKFNSDGRMFASTHGDHTVKIWEWPSGRLLQVLEGHPRTPWAVKWHPTLPNIVASGCLGFEVMVWNAKRGAMLKKCRFERSVSCISFHPNCWFMAITAGWELYLWDFVHDDAPVTIASEDDAFHFVEFHPSGEFMMTGQKNPDPDKAYSDRNRRTLNIKRPAFTLRLTLRRFVLDSGLDLRDDVEFIVPHCVAYNDAGVHFSPCGTLLLACLPAGKDKNTDAFQIATIAMKSHKRATSSIVHSLPLDATHAAALTNLKFSATSRHILAGFSFPMTHPVLRSRAVAYHKANSRGSRTSAPMKVEVIHIYRLGKGEDQSLTLVKSLSSDIEIDGAARDEINIALFAPGGGVSDGLLIGTQRGRIRMFHS